MNLIERFADWRAARAKERAQKDRQAQEAAATLSLVRAFYKADPLSQERRQILGSLMQAGRTYSADAPKIDLRKIRERTDRIHDSFAKSATRHPERYKHGLELREEHRQLTHFVISHHNLNGIARAVIEDRLASVSEETVGRISFVPRRWSEAKTRDQRMERVKKRVLDWA